MRRAATVTATKDFVTSGGKDLGAAADRPGAARRDAEPTVEHRIAILVDRLSPTDAWVARLRPLDRLTPFATSYRYPTPSGRWKDAPAASVIEQARGARGAARRCEVGVRRG